jgi:hypothetical protein
MKKFGAFILFCLLLSDVSGQDRIKWVYPLDGTYDVTLKGITEDEYGNIYAAGVHSGELPIAELKKKLPRPGHIAGFLIKLSPKGKPIWAHNISSKYACTIVSICGNRQGDIAITGRFDGILLLPGIKDTVRKSVPGQGIFTALYSSRGEILWAKAFATLLGEGTGIACDKQGNIYQSLYCRSFLKIDIGQINFPNQKIPYHYIFKYNMFGDTLWTKLLSSPSDRTAGFQYDRLAIDNEQHLILSAKFHEKIFFSPTDSVVNDGYYDSFDSYVARFDPGDGHCLWHKQFSGKNDQSITDFKVDEENNIFLTGMYSLECIVSSDIRPVSSGYKWKSGRSFFFIVLGKDGQVRTIKFHTEPDYTTYFTGSAIAISSQKKVHIFGTFTKSVKLESDSKRIFSLSYDGSSQCNFFSTWQPSGNLRSLYIGFLQNKSWASVTSALISKKNYVVGGPYFNDNKVRNKFGRNYTLTSDKSGHASFIVSYVVRHKEKEPKSDNDNENNSIASGNENQEGGSGFNLPDIKKITREALTILKDKTELQPASVDTVYQENSEIKNGSDPSERRFNIFPNPTEDNINLYVSDVPGSCRIDIYNSSGAILLSQSVTQFQGERTFSFDISQLAPGNYFLGVYFGNEGKYFKIIKN